jgi:hypothetical protein
MGIRKFVLPPLGCCVTLFVGFSLLFGGVWIVRAGVKAERTSHRKLTGQDDGAVREKSPGKRDESTKFPQSMLVEYVRVYTAQ